MSRKRATAQTSRAAQRRADAAAERRSASASTPAGRRPARPGPMVIGGIVAGFAALVVGVAVFALGANRTVPAASPSPPPTALPTPAGSQLTGGGPLAQKVVAALHADPFRAHIDETTVARSTKGTVTVTLTAKAAGDVSGKDVSLHVSSTGGGPAIDQAVVSLGNTTWIRRTGATTWEVHRRAEAASSIDGLLATIRLLDDPNDLADAGMDTVDGQSVHRLTAVGTIAYRSPDGTETSFDRLDIWTTDDGTPVLARGSFSSSAGTTALVGNVSIRYTDVGKAAAIVPPAGAPTPIP